jgi:thymidylate kinase
MQVVGRKRGLLIVFEGIDRVGKSTQCKMLKDWFINEKHENAERIGFPGILKLIKTEPPKAGSL